MTEVFSVAYIHNFYGLSSDEKFVKIEDYQKLEAQVKKMRCCGNCAKALNCDIFRSDDCKKAGLAEWELKK